MTVAVHDTDELRDAFASHSAVRLVGTDSAQDRLPIADPEAVRVSLAPMQRIIRLEADDLTCSVEPGVRREELDAALEQKGLWLPCPGTGTVGGLFAADELGPAGPAGYEPRSLLLGLSGMLAEGKAFKSGARVVKNVAGFDLQKLFVGSRGALFAATELHLKLRPRPRGLLHFDNDGLEQDAALALMRTLRTHPTRPVVLSFERRASHRVCGTLGGHPAHIETFADQLGLQRVEESPQLMDVGETPLESVRGQVRFSRMRELLASLPAEVPFALHGERFLAHLVPTDSDTLLHAIARLGGAAEVVTGPRRGTRTEADPASRRLTAGLKAALDPGGVLR